MSPFLSPSGISAFRAPFSVFRHPAGGDNRDRTYDPLLAMLVLSLLSFTPLVFRFGYFPFILSKEPQKLTNDSNLGPTVSPPY